MIIIIWYPGSVGLYPSPEAPGSFEMAADIQAKAYFRARSQNGDDDGDDDDDDDDYDDDDDDNDDDESGCPYILKISSPCKFSDL